MYETNRYRAEIVRWLDGDTVELVVDLGQRVFTQDHYRLNRIDAPEKTLRAGTTPEEKRAGLSLLALLSARYPEGTRIEISTHKADKYGRWLVEIWVEQGSTNLNDWLLANNLVVPYP